MRGILALAIVIVGSGATARAEPRPTSTWGAAAIVDLQGIGDRFVLGFGAGASHARQLGAIAVFAEGSVERVSMTVDDGRSVAGMHGRAGLGLRVVPGSAGFEQPGRPFAAMEMRLDAGLAVETMGWDGGGRLSRPGGWGGVGLQVRQQLRGGRQVVLVLEVRVTLMRAWSAQRLTRAVCAGTCTVGEPEGMLDSGLSVMLGFEWGR